MASRAAPGGRIERLREAELSGQPPIPARPAILVLGRDTCEDTTAARAHLTAQGIPFTYRNHEIDTGADALIRAHNDGHLVTPTILLGDPVRPSRVLIEPTTAELDAAIEVEAP